MTARQHHCSPHHANLVDTYRAAREAWLDAAEDATSLYATELEDYRQEHPPPSFKEFLRAQAQPDPVHVEPDVDVDEDDDDYAIGL